MRALVLGHFSTVGDLECLALVRRWLERRQLPCDVAAYSPRIHTALQGSLDVRHVQPGDYSHLVIVCGPCWPELLHRRGINLSEFSHCVRIGVNLTMVKPTLEWNPFDILIERDSDRQQRCDLAFLAEEAPAVVAGRCLIEDQPEYGDRQRHQVAIAAINNLADRTGMAVIDLDTRWAKAGNPLRTPDAFASVLRRVDLLLTNRLHGLVFALRCGVPAIAIDSVAGGDKVMGQAKILGWPMVALAQDATPAWMDSAAAWCRSPEGRTTALACRDRARASLGDLASAFQSALDATPAPRLNTCRSNSFRGLLSRLIRRR